MGERLPVGNGRLLLWEEAWAQQPVVGGPA